ncbi:hypothetical protein [Arcicella lustrica]|uniref:Uncharacterized protein n=1 Tax=Arcicella lustrica TaxID=2984196 RepID=A0ABU5SGR9_9BACT|nr:hypothetical protein [Arcicella sp. DC25W]MEA5426392.1 hypothetical protein [Arcicella sp. DC25W]
MIKTIADLKYGTEPEPNAQNYIEWRANQVGSEPASCYVDGTYDMLAKIETITTMDNFDEMKKALTELYSERYDFVAFAIGCSI